MYRILGESLRRTLATTFLTALVGTIGSGLAQWGVDAIKQRIDPDDESETRPKDALKTDASSDKAGGAP